MVRVVSTILKYFLINLSLYVSIRNTLSSGHTTMLFNDPNMT